MDATDGYGRSLLYIAALGGKTGIVDFLLKAGANPNKTASWKGGDSPLHAAALHGHVAIAEKLVTHGAQVDARNKGHQTPLHYAAWAGRVHVVQALLQLGADAKAVDSQGLSGLHFKPGWPSAGLIGEPPDIAGAWKALLKTGVSVNTAGTRSPKGYTPLMAACSSGSIELVQLLLESGADPAAQTDSGATAYSIAQLNHRAEVLALLRSLGVNR